MVTVSLYARVSSGKQAQENTIASQVAALEKQISTDGYKLLSEYKFIDNGYSGSNLVRPDLEKLRDKVTEGKIDRIYIHSPDRLSRKYAYQMVLLEEFEKAGAETVFLNYEINDNPESQLLLQMQGMIAEYERAKIMERSRRGKIYAANKGCVSVMGGAPYGYRYIDKYMGGGQALFEINEEEANVVRKVFLWIGRERTSIGEVCRRLNTMSIITRTGKKCWDRSVIWGMLKNPAYKGQAAFGKTKVGIKLQHIRPQKHSCEQPKDNYSTYSVEKANWIYVKVPNIVDEDVFDIVQEQLAENRKIARTRERGAKHLLQGLIVCKRCRYAYYGSPVRNKRGEKIDHYAYYRCIGRDSYRFGGNKICDNKHIRTDALETAVWEEVKHLLKNPNRVLEEYRRRLSELKKSSWDQKSDLLEKQENKLKRGIARLIDSYAQEYINQEEFEPRIKAMKQSLKTIEEEKKRIFDQKKLKQELTLVVTNLEDFSSNITSNLDNADWLTKRDIIRTLVKRIEINLEDVNVVFRVKELPNSPGNNREEKKNLQHCWRGISPIISNIFMHHAFDMWMKRNYPTVPFERYVDDVIVHCKTKEQADFMRAAIKERLAQCKLKLHPEKTQIVYCKDDNRRGGFPIQSFDFLGYTFRPRLAKNNKVGTYFVSFLPAISNKAKKKICQVIRSWKIRRQTSTTLEEISRKVNPIVRGWFQYYGRFYRQEIYKPLKNIERQLEKWVKRKYRKLRTRGKLARQLLGRVRKENPDTFYHWTLGLGQKTE